MKVARRLPVTSFARTHIGPFRHLEAKRVGPRPDSEYLGLQGQFALHAESNGEHLLIRDPLGVNKLFFTIDSDEDVHSSNYLIDLVERGVALDRVWSVPSGHSVRIQSSERRYELREWSSLRINDSEESDLAEPVDRIRRSLADTFEALRPLVSRRPIYVTMSGGMDSSTIAFLAREHFEEVRGVTFSLGDESGLAYETEDLAVSRRLAGDLGMNLAVVSATADEIIDLIDEVLVLGQDWRDFNVHAGLVNAVIARWVEATTPLDSPRPVVLTGDVMNELMSDYTPVTYRGERYYALPNVGRASLRRFLVRGLDSGDREVGIFARHGVDVIQPFALCAPAYLGLPAGNLGRDDAKALVVGAVMGDRIPAYVTGRPKVRAQAGGADNVRGTLSVLADAGVDSGELKRRFAGLLQSDLGAVDRLIRTGMYRFATNYPE